MCVVNILFLNGYKWPIGCKMKFSTLMFHPTASYCKWLMTSVLFFLLFEMNVLIFFTHIMKMFQYCILFLLTLAMNEFK